MLNSTSWNIEIQSENVKIIIDVEFKWIGRLRIFPTDFQVVKHPLFFPVNIYLLNFPFLVYQNLGRCGFEPPLEKELELYSSDQSK